MTRKPSPPPTRGSISDVYARADVRAANVARGRAAEAQVAQSARMVTPKQVAPILASMQGEAPTPERAVKTGVEKVCTGRIDSAQRMSTAIRASNTWWPRTLYERGRLTKKQFCAADRLVEQWEMARFDALPGQPWDMPVDHSGGGGEVSATTQRARRELALVMATLLPAERGVVRLVVIDGRTIEAAMELQVLRDLVMQRGGRQLQTVTSAVLSTALERIAAHYRF